MNTNIDNKNTRRGFLAGALAGIAGIASAKTLTGNNVQKEMPATTKVETANVPTRIKSLSNAKNLQVGELFWHNEVLYVKITASKFDQVYPAIATYA